jgi:hypothetical protein
MSLRSLVGVVSLATIGAITVYGMGCSSSSTQGTPDSGTAPHTDSGAPHDSGSASDSTSPPSDSSMAADTSGGGDAALVCPPASTTTYMPAAYVPAVAHQGKCSPADIAAFVMACGDNATMTATTSSCGDYQAANVMGVADGGVGTTCGNCIFAATNNGATWLDPANFFGPNYAGCIQLTDSANGAACAAAYDNAGGCEGVACDKGCQTDTEQDFVSCVKAADQGSCSTYAAAEKSACVTDFADAGAAATCSPGAGTGKSDPDWNYIVNLICGGAVSDSGAD